MSEFDTKLSTIGYDDQQLADMYTEQVAKEQLPDSEPAKYPALRKAIDFAMQFAPTSNRDVVEQNPARYGQPTSFQRWN